MGYAGVERRKWEVRKIGHVPAAVETNMDGGGLSVGGVAGIGVAVGAGFNIPMAPASQPAAAVSGNGLLAPGTTDFVVTISDAAMRALAVDAASVTDSSSTSRLADDLAALALLAILERDQRQNNSLAAAAAAVAAYLAVQAMSNG